MPERAEPDNVIWSRKYGFFPTPALKYLIKRYSICRPIARGKKVLDVPCGTGMGADYLDGVGELFGFDYSSDALSAAREKKGKKYHALDQGTMESLPYEDSSFDVVLCLEGIEHVQKDIGLSFVSEAWRVLRKGGILVISSPVGGIGIHSGNEFHTYEWGEAELQTAVSRGFSILKSLLLPGPQGNVQILVCERSNTRPEMFHAFNVLSNSLDRLKGWHKTTRREGGASAFTSDAEPEFLSTCFSVLLSETSGTLGLIKDTTRSKIGEYILSYQDEQSGSFSEKLVKSEDLCWSNCDVTYVRNQVNYFALSALHSLGVRPKHLYFAEPFLKQSYAIGYLDGGPWHDPWNHSNRVMFLLRYVIEVGKHAENDSMKIVDSVLEYLDTKQEPKTGLWHGTSNASIREAIFAAYHFYPFYFWRGLKPRYVEPAIDSILSIQHPDGLFGTAPGGGACEDLDAIDALVKLSYISSHRSEEIESALKRSYFRILQMQNEDGGFANYPSERMILTWRRKLARNLKVEPWICRPLPSGDYSYYSGWRRVRSKRGQSDLWGAWFRLLSLALISERMPELGDPVFNAVFHTLPALGWHSKEKVVRSCR